MQTTTPQNNTAPPVNTEKTDFKEFVRVLVILCNEKIKNYHINRLLDNEDLKTDLIELMDHFDELFLNTKDLIVYSKPQMSLKVSGAKDLSITDLCQLIDKWIKMDGYDVDEPISTIFDDGANLFNYYLNALINSGLYKAV